MTVISKQSNKVLRDAITRMNLFEILPWLHWFSVEWNSCDSPSAFNNCSSISVMFCHRKATVENFKLIRKWKALGRLNHWVIWQNSSRKSCYTFQDACMLMVKYGEKYWVEFLELPHSDPTPLHWVPHHPRKFLDALQNNVSSWKYNLKTKFTLIIFCLCRLFYVP